MHPIYQPTINQILRRTLKPFAPWIPETYHFPVTGVIQVDLPEGQRIRLACNPTSFIGKVLFWKGYRGFEPGLTDLFIALIKKASVFVDVGANIGYYTLVASAFNPMVKIICFEPLPAAFRYLTRNLTLNQCTNVTAERVALSDKAGTTRFFFSRNPKFLDLEGHLTSTGSLDAQQATRTPLTESFDVQTDTLDLYAEQHLAQPIDVLKLDTEATEHIVLQGAEQVLTDHRPIILCEVLPGKIEVELETLLGGHGYRFYRAEAGRLDPVERLVHSERTTNDYMMVHPDRLDAVKDFLG